MLELHTRRLKLLAWTRENSADAIGDRAMLACRIDADVPPDWPPETLADVEGVLAGKLVQHPEQVGWWGWYIIAKAGEVGERATLIGSAGCSRWGEGGLPHFGYGLVPAYFRRGFGTEAALALIEWTMSQPGVTRVVATTFERHHASIKILERCGFRCEGVSPEDATAAESDRQGRGRLLQFVREKAAALQGRGWSP